MRSPPFILGAFLACALIWSGRGAGRAEESIPVSNEWQFRAWQTDEGLPDNSVTGVAQAPDGYLWAATYGGLLLRDTNATNARAFYRVSAALP